MIKLKTPALLFQKGREFIPCYHLYSQATCVTCLTEYGRSDTLAPVTVCFPSQPTWLILSVRNSKMYSHFLFMSLSSTGIFLYEIKNATLSFHRLYNYVRTLFYLHYYFYYGQSYLFKFFIYTTTIKKICQSL
jgi:hypothetical protein